MAAGRGGGGDTRGRFVERDDDDGRPTYEDRGPPRVAGVIIALAVLALVAIVASFLLTQPRKDLPAGALSGAAATVAGTVERATQETARQPTR